MDIKINISSLFIELTTFYSHCKYKTYNYENLIDIYYRLLIRIYINCVINNLIY